MAKITPMMEQYMSIKKQYKYCLLFFRLGDFYELFYDDAVIASKELEITLTGKSCGLPEKAPMCGVPFHSADSYIARLVEKGYKVAICEQMEDPKEAKGVVKRDVIRIVTPGTVTDPMSLEEDKNNYIMCIYEDNKGFGLAYCDISTGEFSTARTEGFSSVKDEIARLLPSEIIVCQKFYEEFAPVIEKAFDIKAELYPEAFFEFKTASDTLQNHFGSYISLNELKENPVETCASGALMKYLGETQKNSLEHINTIKRYSIDGYMLLDMSSRRNLELTASMRDKGKKGSLMWVLDRTKTAMGARLLRKWIEQPLVDINAIQKRLDAVEILKDRTFDREEIRELLNNVYDIERLMSKVVYGSCNCRDLVSLKQSFGSLPHIQKLLNDMDNDYISQISENINNEHIEDMYNLIENSIMEDGNATSVKDGDIIKDGYNSTLDRYREVKREGARWIEEMEAEEREATGIKNLKISSNNVFHYYIEVTNSYRDRVPERYTRKQTLANCERYITPELKELETTILNSEEQIAALEYDIFRSVKNEINYRLEIIKKAASAVAELDVLQSLAVVAENENYCKPTVNKSDVINIRDGRHPVVEKLTENTFIPNDTLLDEKENRLAVITGPNMAGKSTYMRQTAIIVLMAQIGSFVPASQADIGVVDRIFTRVGASDDLATGQSTFMLEMSEVANILNNATKSSLLILDEIGRGTSTYDGLSIAWAVLEYIADKNIGARTLFATHYHELTELENRVEGVRNYSVSVREQGDEVIFLRKIVKGGTDKSFGIYVAKLAGIPKKVLKRAAVIRDTLGKGNTVTEIPENTQPEQEDVYGEAAQEAADKILELDMDDISPRQAYDILLQIKKQLSDVKQKNGG